MQLVKHRHTIELIFKLRATALLIFYVFMHNNARKAHNLQADSYAINQYF